MLSSRCCWGNSAVVCAPAVDRPLPPVADFGVDQSEFCFWPKAELASYPSWVVSRPDEISVLSTKHWNQ